MYKKAWTNNGSIWLKSRWRLELAKWQTNANISIEQKCNECACMTIIACYIDFICIHEPLWYLVAGNQPKTAQVHAMLVAVATSCYHGTRSNSIFNSRAIDPAAFFWWHRKNLQCWNPWQSSLLLWKLDKVGWVYWLGLAGSDRKTTRLANHTHETRGLQPWASFMIRPMPNIHQPLVSWLRFSAQPPTSLHGEWMDDKPGLHRLNCLRYFCSKNL